MIDLHYSSTDQTLVLQASGILTTRDYEQDFEPLVERALMAHPKLNLVLFLDENFEGWDFGAMWDDAKFGLKHRHDFNRIAIVGAQVWFRWAFKLGSAFLDGQFIMFPGAELSTAINWAKTGQMKFEMEDAASPSL